MRKITICACVASAILEAKMKNYNALTCNETVGEAYQLGYDLMELVLDGNEESLFELLDKTLNGGK